MHVENVRVKPADYGPTDFKHAMMSARTLSEPIKGNLILKDAGGKTLQKITDFTLAQLPYYTPHHTFLIDGNPRAVNGQLRMKPGVYTRKKRNEELEAQFNTVGNPFRMTMDPENGHFHLEFQSTKIPLYPILNKLGIDDAKIEKHWNRDLVTANRDKFGKKPDQYFDKLYSKIVRTKEESPDKAASIQKAFERTQLDPEVTKELLGTAYTHVTPDTLLAASQKLLRVYNEKLDFDERDSLAHKRLMGVDDFIAERIKLDARALRRKIMMRLEYGQPNLEHAVPVSPFTKGIKNFLNTSMLSGSPPTQINPLEIMDSAVKVTSMGEGGIASDRAVPLEARHLHSSHLGVLDPVRTPESYRAGIELRTGMFTARDRAGNIYTALTDSKGKTKFISTSEAAKKSVAFPSQGSTGKIDVLQGGKLRSIPASQVDYTVPNINAMYTFSTNLIPFLENIDGNRAEMGSKMVTQALPLLDAEPPLVQVASYRPGLSMEQELARKVTPHAKLSGVVTKIKDGYIHIKSKDAKTAAVHQVPYFENFPLASKTYLHDTLTVKVGDEVKKDQPLANSPFAKDGQLTLGKNLRVAYVPFRGMNSNDAIVASETGAKKLTSLHMYREGMDIDRDTRPDKELHRSYFGNKFNAEHYKTLGNDGLVKPGTKVNPGDPLIVAVKKATLSPDARMLGRLHNSLVKPYRDASVVWEHDTPGVVTDVARTGNKIRLTVRTEESLKVGDKLCLSSETGVLTLNGWKPVTEITVNDLCYTINSRGKIELQEPTALHRYPIAGEMYTLNSQQVDLRVTSNHKLYVKPRSYSEFKLIPAIDVIGKKVRHKKNAIWKGKTPKFFTIPTYAPVKRGKGCVEDQKAAIRFVNIPTQQWLLFLGVYLANGCVAICEKTNSNDRYYYTQLSSIKGVIHSVSGDQHSWIRTILDNCQFPYTEKDDRFVIHSKQLALYLKQFGHAFDKYVPREIFTWGQDAATWLLEGLVGCDGSKIKSGTLHYVTISPQLANDVQQLALHAGYAANIAMQYPSILNLKEHPRFRVKFIRKRCEPHVYVKLGKHQHGQHEEIIRSDEPVYGVTVPNHTLYVRVNGKPVWSGNSGRFGNKGVISAIVPDEQMLQNEDGRPIDIALSPASVVSRLNPSQILESAVAKVAEKTGKPVIVTNFSGRDNVKWAKELLKEHGLSDTETLTDPATGKKLKKILTGPQYMYKLMKTTETNYSARGLGNYDVDQQPSTGGAEGSKGLGRMEFSALVAHDARNVLKELASLKSQKNDEWWRAYQLGLPPPPLKTSFAYDKFGAMLAGAGVKMNKRDSIISLGPLTDAETEKMSSGAIQKGLFVKAKDLSPERGGLFDPVVTGGLNGTKWAHLDLRESVVNPIFERPVKSLLGLKATEFSKIIREEGGPGIRSRLSEIDLSQRENETLEELKKARSDKRDGLVKQLKYIRALREGNLRPENAYVVSKIPVIPPIYRPIIPGKTGDLLINDANHLLRDTFIANDQLAKVYNDPQALRSDAREHLYNSVSALYGMSEPVSPQLQARNVKGYVSNISGVGSPKRGFFQAKMIKRQQDLSGRGTIVPDATLAMDEVGLPEEAGWTMFAPFVIKGLVQKGYSAVEAKKLVEERHPVAKEVLLRETQNRPIFVNRAPTLYRYNILAAYPKLVPGKTIRVHEAMAPIVSGDFDGDAVNLSVPITPAAVEEAKLLTLPHMLLSDQSKFTLTKAAPQQEAVLGLYKATSGNATGKAQTFENKGDALAAYHRGEITLNTPVTIKKQSGKH